MIFLLGAFCRLMRVVRKKVFFLKKNIFYFIYGHGNKFKSSLIGLNFPFVYIG